MQTLFDLMNYCNNFFEYSSIFGNFEIRDNKIDTHIEGAEYESSFVNRYILITESTLNDGLYKVGTNENGKLTLDRLLQDETFRGHIYTLAIPEAFIKLSKEIEEWTAKNTPTNIKSESFGNYSVSYTGNDKGQISTWQNVFSHKLIPYKKMFKKIFI